jgi:DNA-binding response OmpR family regulator
LNVQPLQRPRFCLLVEEQPKVGLDLADALDTAGFFVAGPLTSGQAALDWLARFTPDIAIVDPVLKDGTYAQLFATLQEREIPVVVHSTQGLSEHLLPILGGIWMQRPYVLSDMINLLVGLLP